MYRVDDVQGEEFRALIISTVRTCTKEPSPEEDGGFLTDPRVYVIKFESVEFVPIGLTSLGIIVDSDNYGL